MSRGLGRLQRAILDVLQDPQPPIRARYYNRWSGGGPSPYGRAEGQRDDELTTHHVAERVSELGWWWDDDGSTLTRQVRRALDALHTRSLVAKRAVPLGYRRPNVDRTLWSLVRPSTPDADGHRN